MKLRMMFTRRIIVYGGLALALSCNSFIAWGATRAIYYSATSTNNLTYDSNEVTKAGNPQGYGTFCTITVMNLSKTTQRFEDFTMNYHVTSQSSGAENPLTSIMNVNHTARRWRANHWYAGWMMHNFRPHVSPDEGGSYPTESVAVPTTGNPSLSSPAFGFVLQRLDSATNSLKTSTPNQIDLAPQSMLIMVGRNWVEYNNYCTPKCNHMKTFNTCTGSIKVSDNPQTGQPKNGFVVATGLMEYMADSVMNKRMNYGEAEDATPTWGHHTDAYGARNTQLKVETDGRIFVDREIGRLSDGTNFNGVACGLTAGLFYSVSAEVACTAVHQVTNSSNSVMFPQHVASAPFVVGGGKPF